MNNLVRNKNKKAALVLATVFAWLFIGSLIIFHQEHVLGKHMKLNTQLFISPKSKDKKETGNTLQPQVQKFTDHSSHSDVLSGKNPSLNAYTVAGIKYWDYLPVKTEDIYLTGLPLRAPPVV
jgi:hypothetical protein